MGDICLLAAQLLYSAQTPPCDGGTSTAPLVPLEQVNLNKFQADATADYSANAIPAKIPELEFSSPHFPMLASITDSQHSASVAQTSDDRQNTSLKLSSQLAPSKISLSQQNVKIPPMQPVEFSQSPEVTSENLLTSPSDLSQPPNWPIRVAAKSPSPRTLLQHSANAPSKMQTVLPKLPRPTSGSQLYQQRKVALQSGKLYTRLPTHSFQTHWSNASYQPTYGEWRQLLRAEARAIAKGQGNNRLSIVVGDSLSLWLPTERLPRNQFWLNQGISGDSSLGVLRRLSAFQHTRPTTIHVMVGINDLRQGAADNDVLWNLRRIMQELRHAHPQAQIYIHSILPTRLPSIPTQRIQRINQRLQHITEQEQVNYLDLQAMFSDTQGQLRHDLTTDGIHLNAQGYAVWQLAMR